MAIEGFLEDRDNMRICGWAYDPDQPDHHVSVSLMSGERMIGELAANLYRRDLAEAGVGNGDHAFVFNCEPPLNMADLAGLSARAFAADGQSKTLPSYAPPRQAQPSPPRQPVIYPGPTQDLSQHPVFILGSARSGTSALAQALRTATRYAGQEEGHFIEILAPLIVHIEQFYVGKHDELAPDRDTMIARVPETYMRQAVANAMITAIAQLFPEGHWFEKTPSADMIHLAPRLRQIWPQARFIFMKRRGIDNIASRLRKFDYDFERNCREWAQAMQAWLDVRGQLEDVSLELDQYDLATRPHDAAAQIGTLIALDETETVRLASALATIRPQRTNPEFSSIKSLEEVGWTNDQIVKFNEICGDLMKSFSYSLATYYA